MEEVTLPELPAAQMNVEVWDSEIRGLHQANAPYFTADQMREFARAAVLMERERCAKVCEQLAEKGPGNWKHGTPGDCAAAIRKGE